MAKLYYRIGDVEQINDSVARVALFRRRKTTDYDKDLVEAGGAKNGYVTTYSNGFVEFIGKKVVSKLMDAVKDYPEVEKEFNGKKRTVREVSGKVAIQADIAITNEPYVSNGKVLNPKGYKHTVYDFDLGDNTTAPATPATKTTAPKEVDEDVNIEDDPFADIVG